MARSTRPFDYCEYARGKRVWLGRADVLGVSEARESARAILADFYRGIDPIEARKPKAVMPRYGAYLDGDYAMTLRYAHLAPELKLKAVEVLDLARETAMGGNKVVALVADRDLAGSGVQVEMFGKIRRMPAGPAALALRTGAPLVPCAVYSRPGGWLCVMRDPIHILATGDRRADVTAITQALAKEFEALISVEPADWHVFQPGWACGSRWCVRTPGTRPGGHRATCGSSRPGCAPAATRSSSWHPAECRRRNRGFASSVVRSPSAITPRPFPSTPVHGRGVP